MTALPPGLLVELQLLGASPRPLHKINPEVAGRLRTDELAAVVMKYYKAEKIEHLQITEAGRGMLNERRRRKAMNGIGGTDGS